MAYYDVTTHAFESVKQGELRMFGFSKDHKNNEVQVVMGMLIDNNGIPISFELFPGNTMDQKTLETAVNTETARLDEQKIDRQAQFDGYYAIITNETDYSTDTVSKLYGGLWKIEESFRVLKTDLAASPAFVWRDDRVLGHFTLCFIALCFLRYTQYVLEDSGKNCASAAVLMNSWQQASVTVVGEYPDIRLSPTRLDKVYLDLLQCLEMKPLYTYMTPYEFRIATGLKVNAQLQDYYNRTQKK